MTEQHALPDGGSGRANRNLILACKKANDYWFPVSPKHFQKIKDGIASGAYDLGIEFLITEIRADFALFTYCLREVRKELKRRGTELPPDLEPNELLRWSGMEILKKVLDVPAERISPHSLSDDRSLQVDAIREALIGASTAAVLSERTGVDGELSYSAGLLRHLGLTLIAWNYPNVYRRTMQALKPGQDLDQEISRVLGFSPGVLGIAMARQWSLSPELRYAMGDQEAVDNFDAEKTDKILETAATLEKICEVGEALARANNPEQYPSAVHDWKLAETQIYEMLGPDGLRIIGEHVKENCAHYAEVAPGSFQRAQNIRKEPGVSNAPSRPNALAVNKYVKHCPEDLQIAIRELYTEINPDRVSKDLIGKLVKNVIPKAGFVRGCIYLLEPSTMKLVPRLKIGNARLEEFAERSTSNSSPTNQDSIEAAFTCSAPIIESKGGLALQGLASITSVIGKSQRVGVLYLEMEHATLHNQRVSILMCYKAILGTLSDILRLR